MLLDYKAKHHVNVNGDIPHELFSTISGFTERVIQEDAIHKCSLGSNNVSWAS